MDAKEAAALYDRAWAAGVPRPKGLYFSDARLAWQSKPEPEEWRFANSQNEADSEHVTGAYEGCCPNDAALALCRVTCEDWLLTEHDLHLTVRADGTIETRISGREPMNGLIQVRVGMRETPTIHHALVIAVEAVASHAKG